MIARIAVIGAGTFGEMHLRAFTQMEREGRARLVGVADIDAELVATRRSQYGVATFLDYREMIEKTNPDGRVRAGVSVGHKRSVHRRRPIRTRRHGLSHKE